MRIFLDTNVLLDFVCKREGFYDDALNVFKHIYMGRSEGCLSALSYITSCYVAHHYKKSETEMAHALNDIRETVFTVSLTDEIVGKALSSDWADKEDAAQFFCAKNANADLIVTRNAKDFALSDIPVLTPDQFVAEHISKR